MKDWAKWLVTHRMRYALYLILILIAPFYLVSALTRVTLETLEEFVEVFAEVWDGVRKEK